MWPLYTAVFIALMGFSIQIPIFTSLMLHEKHSPLITVLLGFMLGLYPLGQFIGSPMLGAFSDKFGRKSVILCALSFSTIFYFCISLSLLFDWWYWIFLFLFLAGLTDGNIAITQGAIADVTSDDARSKYFGYIYVCSSTAFILGPLLSSLFSRFGISATFWVITLLFFALTTFIACFFRETLPHWQKKEHNLSHAVLNLTDIIRNHHLRYYYAVNFIIYLSIFGYLRVYAMYVEEMYHVGIVLLSAIVAYVSLPFIIMNLIVVPLLSKTRAPKSLTMIFSWLMGIFMILIVVPEYFYSLWITLFLTTAALALTMTFSTVMLSLMAQKDKQGAVMGNNQSLLSLAQALSAFSAGTLAAIANRLPLIAFGLLGLVAGTLLLRKRG